ncbi:DUF6221 family protein [Micromonospora tarensis]|uniref:DUF4254 domain-containing protein n=1 Tax=Micromonospora tarensis TaxID=2806100 RepID=A0ABS1YCJ0_9ACTN|nr:DUF6221 family protein [Micromonospora tarensis]MBM0275110.1 hypothetical protein [Micromonospora tarensis]
MTDLVTWLRAQLDDDESGAQAIGPNVQLDDPRLTDGEIAHVTRWGRTRALAEVDAKRRHIARWERTNALLAAADNPGAIRNELLSVRRAFADVIADDALPYADRPGYRDEWRPA